MNDLETLVLVNGEIVTRSAATLPLTHPVFTSSFGVYETIQIDHGQPFHLTEHIQRLQQSGLALKLPLPAVETLLTWAQRLIAALPPEFYTLKILAIGPATVQEPHGVVIFFPIPTTTYPAEYFTAGAAAITFEGARILPQVKSFNTLVSHLARENARQTGAIEGILCHNGHLFEGARSNLFVVQANTGRLCTPPAADVLSGITRDLTIQLMAESDHPVHEVPIRCDVPAAEMFVTSTSMHVLPITRFNGEPVGDGRIGPVTREASRRFEAYYQAYFG